MTAFFDISHRVSQDEIDSQLHVHNLQYLQWTLWAARDHSAACGWDSAAGLRQGVGWVVRSHNITYRAAAVAGDEIVIRTWVSELARFASNRKCYIYRPADQAILAKAETRWVFVDLKLHKCLEIPPEVCSKMTLCESNPPAPWA